MKKKDSEVIWTIVNKIKKLEEEDKKLGNTWSIDTSLFKAEVWVQKKRKIENQITVLEEILDEVL